MKRMFVLLGCLVSMLGFCASDFNRLGLPGADEIRRSVLNEGDSARLEALFEKAERGETVSIAALGGSITEGAGSYNVTNRWSAHMMDWFARTFPKAKIVRTNAGIGATGSRLGCHRIARQIAPAKPDFVTVDFSVNDKAGDRGGETMEGCVRQLLNLPSHPAVMLVSFLTEQGVNVQDEHLAVARHYSLPQVSVRDTMWPRIKSGDVVWRDYSADAVHPNVHGHPYAAALVTAFLERKLADWRLLGNCSNRRIVDCSIDSTNSPPLHGTTYDWGRLTMASDVKTTELKGFARGPSRHGEKFNGVMAGTRPGDRFAFESDAATLTILLWQLRADYGRARVTVDGKSEKVLEGWFDATWGGKAHPVEIYRDRPGHHVVEIEILDEMAKESNGHRFEICAVLEQVPPQRCAGQALGKVLSFKVDADKPDCLYRCGETAKISVTAVDTNGVVVKAGKVSVVFDNFGDRKVCPDRVVDLAKENPFIVSGSRTTPGFLRLTLKPLDKGVVGWGNRGYDGKSRVNEPYYYGVAFEPERIETGTPNPDDFDGFWADAIRRCEETVPLDPKMELLPERSTKDINVFRVSFATVQNRRVYGWLCEPKDLSKGPFRTKVSVPGAGFGATVPTGGEAGVVRLLLNVHTYPQPESDAAYGSDVYKKPYDRQNEVWAKPFGVKGYYLGGIHLGRERYFYYATILGINRAVDWLAARPECDRNSISYSGTSQGGGFGLILTALNKNIRRSCIFVPALTDLLGSKVEERESGWPRLVEEQLPENRAAAEKWAPYFCGVNFARRITCPIRFVVGFADTVCPPHAGYAAYNVCPSKDKKIINGIAMFHSVFGEFYGQLGDWQNQ